MHKIQICFSIGLICVCFLVSCTGFDRPSQTENTYGTTAVTTATAQAASAVTSDMQSEERENALTESEKQALLDEMPEIVFVRAERYWEDENIYGYYLLKTGEIRLFDFRNITPDKIYDIPDVYDRLEEADCDSFEFYSCAASRDDNGEIIPNIIYKDNMRNISEDEIIDCYNRLKYTDGIEREYITGLQQESFGEWVCFGIRRQNGKDNVICLCGDETSYRYICSDTDKVCAGLGNDVYNMFEITG